MSILAFDTCMPACSAAVLRGDSGKAQLFRVYEQRERGHAEAIVPMILDVMAQAQIGFGELDRLAVTVGPGSFSGVRIGVATARGLALASGLPVARATTLEVMARQVIVGGGHGQAQCLGIAHDARRGEVYLGLFDRGGAPLSEPIVVGIDDALNLLPHSGVVVAGNGGPLLAEAAMKSGRILATVLPDLLPDAGQLAEMAGALPVSTEPLRPLYLRAPDAKPQTAQILLRQP
jgi:tRNA threonylcarbamoyladenosine biosynthesis protein TsaB